MIGSKSVTIIDQDNDGLNVDGVITDPIKHLDRAKRMIERHFVARAAVDIELTYSE
jgi:hypothetical protein